MSRSLFVASVTFGCVILALNSGSQVPAAAPTLERIFPSGGQRGTSVTVRCAGEFDWPVSIWAPGIDVQCGDDSGELRISVPKNLATDRAWIRLYNSEGATRAVPFLIGSLAEASEAEPNNSSKTAQTIDDPRVTINGVIEKSDDVDVFAVELTAGQRLVAAVDANKRLGSPMDAILQVTLPDGSVVAENHDNVGLDPRLAFTAKRTSKYFVRIFAFPASPNSSIAFHGGKEYVYRLTLTTGPLITHATPHVVADVFPQSVEVLGWNVPPGTRCPVVPLWDAMSTELLSEWEATGDQRCPVDARIGFVFAPGFAGSARVRRVPYEPTFTSTLAPSEVTPSLTTTSVAAGRLRYPGQTDTYSIVLEKDQPIVIAVEGQSFDLPVVPLVRLLDPTGMAAAEVLENGPDKDAVIQHTPQHRGDYSLTVTDRYRRGGQRFDYQIMVRPDVADFELATDTDAIVVGPDEAVELKVTVKRRHSMGPIVIHAVGLPGGVHAPAVTSETSGDTAGAVTLTFESTGTRYSGPIRILGTASDPKRLTRSARTPAVAGTANDILWLTAISPMSQTDETDEASENEDG